MTNVEYVGTMQTIYTVEPDKEKDGNAIVTFWLQSGNKIGSISVPRESIEK